VVRGTNNEELMPEEPQTALTKYSKNLTALAKENKLDPVIGRNDELRR
jgi:ATP-dependent Clp protease ATP-binding subunit ClpB